MNKKNIIFYKDYLKKKKEMSFVSSSDPQTFRLDLGSFNPRGIEMYLYTGCTITSPFVQNIVRSTWIALGIRELRLAGDTRNGYTYGILPAKNITADFIRNVFVRWSAPRVDLLNTKEDELLPLPTESESQSETQRENDITASTVDGSVYATVNLDLTAGNWEEFAPFVPLITTNSADSAFNSDSLDPLTELRGAYPKHRVYWTKNLLTNFLNEIVRDVAGESHEILDRIYFDLHTAFYASETFRQQIDFHRGNRSELTTPLLAAVGDTASTFIQHVDDLMYLIPFYWSVNRAAPTYRVTDKSTSFPLVQYWGNPITFQINAIENITDLLIFEREKILPLSVVDDNNVVLVPDIFANVTFDTPSGSSSSTGVSVYKDVPGYTSDGAAIGYVNGTLVLDPSTDVGSFIENGPVPFGVSTNEFIRVLRASDSSADSTVGNEVLVVSNYIKPVTAEAPQLYIEFGAVTEYERFLQRIDCRNKELLGTRVSSMDQLVLAGEEAVFDLTRLPGNISHYMFAVENYTARLAGDYSNYTNDADGFLLEPAYKHASVRYNSRSNALYRMPPAFFEFMTAMFSAPSVPTIGSGLGLISKACQIANPVEVSGSFTPSNTALLASADLLVQTKPAVTVQQQIDAQERRRLVFEQSLGVTFDEATEFTSVNPTKRYDVHLRAVQYTIVISNSWQRLVNEDEGEDYIEYMDNQSTVQFVAL